MKRLLRRLRRFNPLKLWVTGCWAFLCLFIVREEYEEVRERARACEIAHATRADMEQNEIRVFERLGHELGAPQERIDAFVATIEMDFDELPEPASCGG